MRIVHIIHKDETDTVDYVYTLCGTRQFDEGWNIADYTYIDEYGNWFCSEPTCDACVLLHLEDPSNTWDVRKKREELGIHSTHTT